MSVKLEKQMTKITYLVDPKNPNRVVTVASRVMDTQADPSRKDRSFYSGRALAWGVAVNRPTEWKTSFENRDSLVYYKNKGDAFNKKLGRTIAVGRLERSPDFMHLFNNETTEKQLFTALLKELSHSSNGLVRRAALAAWEDWQLHLAESAEVSVAAE
jgi:hypothetical protein